MNGNGGPPLESTTLSCLIRIWEKHVDTDAHSGATVAPKNISNVDRTGMAINWMRRSSGRTIHICWKEQQNQKYLYSNV